MGKGNLMIRMIDVVFILLFGFVAVSQISKAEALDPSKSTEAEQEAPEGAHIVIISVHDDGSYATDGGARELPRLYDVRRYIVDEMKRAKANDKQVGVRIRASWNAPATKSLEVAKLCRGLGLPKGLDVVKTTSF